MMLWLANTTTTGGVSAITWLQLIGTGGASVAVIYTVTIFLKHMRESQKQYSDTLEKITIAYRESQQAIVREIEHVGRKLEAVRAEIVSLKKVQENRNE